MKYVIIIKPGTSQEKIIEKTPGQLIIYLRAKAHDNEANEALIKLLSKHFKTPKTSIKIIHGHKSHTKIIEL